jgi:hypothetical protein
MSTKGNKTIYTIVDEKQVQVLYPEGHSKTYKQLPHDDPKDFGLDTWEDLTDEEIDELFG